MSKKQSILVKRLVSYVVYQVKAQARMIVHSLRSPSLGLCRMRIVFAVVRKLIRQDDTTRTPSSLPPSLQQHLHLRPTASADDVALHPSLVIVCNPKTNR